MLEWRDIPGVPNYQASNTGLIRSVDTVVIRRNGVPHTVRGKVLSDKPTTHGYVVVNIRRVSTKVHRLVCLVFLGPPSPGQIDVNHKDGDRGNNRLENLEWATRSRNVLHAIQELGSQSGAPWGSDDHRMLKHADTLSGTYAVQAPDGSTLVVHNLAKLCRENNLHAANLRKQSKARKAYKGWLLLETIAAGNQRGRKQQEGSNQ